MRRYTIFKIKYKYLTPGNTEKVYYSQFHREHNFYLHWELMRHLLRAHCKEGFTYNTHRRDFDNKTNSLTLS